MHVVEKADCHVFFVVLPRVIVAASCHLADMSHVTLPPHSSSCLSLDTSCCLAPSSSSYLLTCFLLLLLLPLPAEVPPCSSLERHAPSTSSYLTLSSCCSRALSSTVTLSFFLPSSLAPTPPHLRLEGDRRTGGHPAETLCRCRARTWHKTIGKSVQRNDMIDLEK